MKNVLFCCFLLISLGLSSCKEDNPDELPLPQEPANKVTSVEFVDDLLFVNKNDFKITTNKPAQFSSTNPLIQISSDGTISRLTSGEVAAIDISWTDQPGVKTTIYALGATDTEHDEPYSKYHGVLATDPYNSYIQGWKTLRKLPVMDQTFAIILRHGDADNGRDLTKADPGEWWKSCDPKLARQLNERGKLRSVETGKIFKDLNYPISRVISSEFCRSVATAQLINAGPQIKIDGRINHSSYTLYTRGSMNAMIEVVKEQPVDNRITLVVLHHPVNETGRTGYPTFPGTSPFTWGGSMLVSISSDKTVTYQGAVSYSMMEYYRNLKLKRL